MATALVILGACPVGTLAQQPEVVLARDYVRATGSPVVVADTFSACDPAGRFALVVDNGPSGEARVSSGTILVNGMEVILEADLGAHVARLERPLTHVGPTNTLEVRLASQPGGTIKVSVLALQSCGPRITSPEPGAILSGTELLVRGTVPSAGDVGVTVNGAPAFVEGTAFVALVPVHPEDTELLVVATMADGSSTQTHHPIVVTAAPEPPVVLRALPGGGAAPLAVSFAVVSRVPVAQLGLDLEGRGVTVFQSADIDALEGQVFTYPAPGVFVPTVTLTDDQGVSHTARVIVHALDGPALDARLRARWQAMKDALRQGDVSRGIEVMALDARATYHGLLSGLTLPLTQIDQVLADPQLVAVDENRAEYQMIRVENGEATSYLVLFVRDVDGVWRLKFF